MTVSHTKDKETYLIRKKAKRFKYEQELKSKQKLIKEVVEYEPKNGEQHYQDQSTKNLE